MTEGNPTMSSESNLAVSSSAGSDRLAEAKPEEKLIAFAPRAAMPVQLEHWLRKRQIGMDVSASPSIDAAEIRSTGASYVLIDLDAYGNGDPAVLRGLRSELPKVKFLVTTANIDPRYAESLTDAGAAGVILKRPYVADVALAVQAASEGRTFVSGQAGQRDAASVQITARERQVLELMANGYSNQAIGEKLQISVKTVEAHRARLFKKLGASNVADAVLLAIRVGLVTP
jgi:DNA-binding NarL/FixJ family response regulator